MTRVRCTSCLDDGVIYYHDGKMPCSCQERNRRMTLQEFAALKAGDKIANHMTSSRGTVTLSDDRGVVVAWCQSRALTFHYGANSTAWMHWEKVDDETKPDTTA